MGPLRALPLLAWVLTGDPSKSDVVRPLIRPAKVNGYARYTVVGKDYPAVVKAEHDDSDVDGLLLIPQNHSQRAKLVDFEGETYKVVSVLASVIDDQGGEVVYMDADMYLWNGDPAEVSRERWDLETFARGRLDDWLALFSGMELVGQGCSEDS